MSLRQSGMYEQFNKLADTQVVSTSVNLEASFVVGSDIVPIFRVLGQRIMENFVDSFAEVNMLSVQIPATVYADTIVPNSNNLMVRLIRNTNQSDGRTSNIPDTNVTLYNAVLSSVSDPYINTLGNNSENNHAVNSMQLVDLHIQLIRPFINTIRNTEVGGPFPEQKPSDVLAYLLSPETETPDGEGIKGVDIEKPDNTKVYRNLEIPTGTPLTRVPKYLQERYGVYASGMGRYLQNGIWYIYPLTDFTRFNRKNKTLTVINIPPAQATSLDQSYIYEAEQLKVFTTGGSEQFDGSDHTQQTQGVAVNFTSASALYTGMAKQDSNKTIPNLTETNKDFSVAERPKGDNRIVTVKGRYTDNPYKYASELSMGLGSLMVFTWENSSPTLLYPGMPVKIQYSKGEDVQVKLGTLFSTETSISPTTGLFTDNDYRSVTKLFVFVERNKV